MKDTVTDTVTDTVSKIIKISIVIKDYDQPNLSFRTLCVSIAPALPLNKKFSVKKIEYSARMKNKCLH